MGAPFDLAGPHRQQRPGVIERLGLALFVDAQHQRPFQRIQIEPDDVACLLHEARIRGQLERLGMVRLQAKRLPDPVGLGGGVAHRPRHRPQGPATPLGGVSSWVRDTASAICSSPIFCGGAEHSTYWR